MSDKLSLLMLNPFSSESVDNSFKFDWLKKYNLKYHWWVKHFMRELWVWKILQTDEEILQELLKWWNKSKFLKTISSCCHKDTAVHFVFPLDYFELYFPFLESWNLKNKLYLHLVYSDVEIDLWKVEKIEKLSAKNNWLIIASISQELSVFNENSDWWELQKFYDEIGFFQIQISLSASEYLKKIINENKKYIAPVSFIDSQAIEDGDVCIIWELDQEKIASISKVFEVSKDDGKRLKFNNFNLIFITKNLPNLELFVVKSPYSIYDNHVFIEKNSVSTLPESFSEKEIRLVELWDRKHLKLLNKYFNNEQWMVFDWHKKVRCEDKYNDNWELAVSSNELLLKRLSDDINNFEVSLISLEDWDASFLVEYLSLVKQEWIDTIIVSFPDDAVYSNLDFSKKNLDWEILHEIIIKEFWL